MRSFRIPKIEVADGEIEVAEDPLDTTRLDISQVPVSVTLCKIGSRFIVDASAEEELCVGVRLMVGVNKKGNVISTQMGGHGFGQECGGVEPTALVEMLQTAQKIGKQLIAGLDAALEKEEKIGKMDKEIGFLL